MRLLIACLAAAASLAVPAAAGAATIIVDSTEDGAATGKCTLRAAIEASNSNSVKDGCIAGSGSDRIEFALAGPATITLGAELPKVSAPVEIDGPGAAALTVSGNHAVRVLKVGGAAVTVSDLTIADGRSTFGAGIYNESSASLLLTGVAVTANQAIVEGGTNAFPSGGGIFNQGQLTLVESSVAQNSAQALLASSQNASEGGGIANLNGTLVLERSTLRGNSSIAVASAGSGTTNAVGGGISNNSALAVLDSTLSGNEASGSGSTIGNRGSGGGISNGNNPGVVNASIIRSTIVGNEAAASTPVSSVGGGGLVLYGTGSQVIGSTIADNRAAAGGANVQFFDAALVRSTIIARPAVGVSCSGTGTSLGFNIDEGTTCGFNQPSDQSGVDALLAPALAANGGPTETLALLFGSPAIDKGLSLGAETIDQRGRLRPVEIPSVPNAPGGNGADVGA